MRKALFISSLLLLFLVASMLYWSNRDRVQNELYRNYYGANGIPSAHMPVYKEAAEAYDVDWRLLASIHRVETIFSKSSNMESSVGALGPFQFMPKTWVGWKYEGGSSLGDIEKNGIDLTDPSLIEKYGGLGTDANADGKADPLDLEDSAHTAAKYLRQHDVRTTSEVGTLEQALYEYNRSNQYVDDVLNQYDLYKQKVVSVDETDVPLAKMPIHMMIQLSERLTMND